MSEKKMLDDRIESIICTMRVFSVLFGAMSGVLNALRYAYYLAFGYVRRLSDTDNNASCVQNGFAATSGSILSTHKMLLEAGCSITETENMLHTEILDLLSC